MRNIFLLILVFSFYSTSAQISFNSGNSQLDSDLNLINAHASADYGSFKADIKLSYNINEKKLEYMKGSLHMAPGEIYLALEISRVAKVPLDEVLSTYKTHKRKGWGFIAKQVGIKPGSAEFHQLKNYASSKKEKGSGKNRHKQKRKVRKNNGHNKV